jgi:serine/threonine protein kinase
VVQRDVKPVNIVFNDYGHAMITALGMATPHEILPRVARAASIARLVPTSTTPV